MIVISLPDDARRPIGSAFALAVARCGVTDDASPPNSICGRADGFLFAVRLRFDEIPELLRGKVIAFEVGDHASIAADDDCVK